LEKGDKLAEEIYENIGIFLGYTLPFYHKFYGMKHLLIMGRVVSGRAGQIIVDNAKKVLKEEFNLEIDLILPDEKSKRVGQSIASASLVKI
ncbi:MAG TPA: transcriptional regulator, partial [Clostridiales bacterium]|nr:transcriptional regulator [Clostridiales bacterium]